MAKKKPAAKPKAAKPSRAARAAAAGLVPPKPSPELKSAGDITMKVPPTAGVAKDMEAIAQLKKVAREKGGEVGKKIATLVEKKNYNARALRIVFGLNEMSQETFAVVWTHIRHLADALEFDKRSKLQGEMFEEDEGEGGDAGTPAGEPDVRPRHLRAVPGGAASQSTFRQIGEAAGKTGTDD